MMIFLKMNLIHKHTVIYGIMYLKIEAYLILIQNIQQEITLNYINMLKRILNIILFIIILLFWIPVFIVLILVSLIKLNSDFVEISAEYLELQVELLNNENK